MLSDKDKQKLIEIDKLVREADNILLVIHKMPDGDAIGSMVAMMGYLSGIDKKYIAFSHDEAPLKYDFLSGTYKIASDKKVLEDNEFDLVIVFDCSTVDYTGIGDYLNEPRNKGKIVIIDHHISNQGWGDINLVVSGMSSTAEILMYYFKENNFVINSRMATALLTGILTDTEVFLNSGTTIDSMEAVANLIELGGRYSYVLKMVYKDKDGEDLRIWGKVLSKIQKNDKFNIAYTVITQEESGGRKGEVSDGISNFIANLTGMRTALVLKEYDTGEIKISLRSLDDKTNVLRIARFFGGGGHEAAAGFTIQGRLERVGSYWQIV